MSVDADFELSPAERRRRRVREAILEAAERVFAQDGPAGLSIRRLADEIDYSPAAIYKYFGSKTELVDELKEAFFARILECVDALNGSETPFRERARICVRTYVEMALEKPHHYVAAFSAADERDGAPAPAQDGSNKMRAFEFLKEMVCEGQAKGVFRNDFDAELAAKSVWSSSHGLAMMMAHLPDFPALGDDAPDPSRREAFIAFHADLVMRGLEA